MRPSASWRTPRLPERSPRSGTATSSPSGVTRFCSGDTGATVPSAGMELRTPRLVLREPRADDAEAIAAACADPEIPRFIPFVPSPYTLDDAHAFVMRCAREWR